MEPIQDFAGLICRLRSLKERKRVVVVCPNDPHTEYVITRSLHEGFADFLLVADTPHLLNSEYIRLQYPDHVKVYEATSPDKAAQEAVSLIREGHADVLMKGIINTDNLLRAVLNKEHGILPKGNVLSHITVAQIPMYKKLLFFSDAALHLLSQKKMLSVRYLILAWEQLLQHLVLFFHRKLILQHQK